MMEPTKLVDNVDDSDISEGSDSDHVDTDELDDSPHRNLCKNKIQENTLKKRKCKLKEKRRRYSKDVDAPKSAESRHREVEEISKMMSGMSSRLLNILVQVIIIILPIAYYQYYQYHSGLYGMLSLSIFSPSLL